MQNVRTTALNRTTLMFPLALVLFEFAVYIGNDLIQPAMLAITQDFAVSATWAPSSMSFYLLGGACVAWLLGPLSDRLGRKRVLLFGVLFFALCCLLILLTHNMAQFLALRFLQGIGLSVITAVGYAAIQETFEERDAIKVMALMANISLLAPLLGPVLGAFLIDYVSWHWGFVAIATLAGLSWFGLKAKMPSQQHSVTRQPFVYLFDDFKKIYSYKRFLGLSLGLPLVGMPLMLWIALSPVMLVDELKFSSVQYGLAQFPIFMGLILGNIVLIKIIDRFPLGKTILMGLPIMLVGTLVLLVGAIWQDYLAVCLLVGMTLISFGEGMSFSVIYRFALMSSPVAKGTVAAAVSMLLMFSFFIMIELVRELYVHFHVLAFSLSCVVLITLWFLLPRLMLKQEMAIRHTHDQF
ncbi:DHA1 family multidrug/chloramphenicol efflux transport protein-like MFS transporter [Acinetobacter baylyi]|uniref:DHA1 family multidrug/chloramphenicol efflux transport protein-like MFS transporter n=1 Tax=Acinetobacter baylyi TaxID=202950 RepID=A0ABU0UWA0_ACIBI|nr:MFS transporter [Acinetobacter baylyi]MDQ1208847.1 DHA1 family multidrug/chloramphenicol efflux transport protein-like MFS transporter [Acinetobacter baylyi]MDR6107560.1 DHA1 family multidrug/chloramphenicol efflux transport protein-like MFS transporter [Acinetobacter baylyi]MDR6185718.1 DHA1 family multidrug/chloramphenicol efflux transport protein-like MFS transporter [Acinetobacter baylyi]